MALPCRRLYAEGFDILRLEQWVNIHRVKLGGIYRMVTTFHNVPGFMSGVRMGRDLGIVFLSVIP